MDKELNDSDLQTSQDGDEGRSLVGKLKKNVSGIITPLSKWFRKDNNTTPVYTTRRRQDDSEDEEDLQEFQPPAKRTKLPPVTKESLCLNVSEVLSPIASNNVKKPAFLHFPEPVAGPSGYETRKMLNSTPFVSDRSHNEIRKANDNNIFKMPREMPTKEAHSDSEESTSGYSSGRVGSKEVLSQQNSKQTSPLETSPSKNRSLFQNSNSERLFTNQTSPISNRSSSLSSRNPSFNPSTFTSPSFTDRTMSTKKILSSPFYNGRTIYGGASAYGRNTGRNSQDFQKVLRQSVKIKPVNRGFEKGNLQLGKTARRILDTLEQYSSPISDAKKIPIASKKRKTEGSLSRFIGANPYTVREIRNASNRELHVPSLTDTLKQKMTQQKTKLQDSTESMRQIATTSNSILNSESYQIPVQREKEKFTSKMKTKITSVRQKLHVDEPVPEVKLNPISLPIKELPKFDFPMLPPPITAPSTTTSSVITMPTVTNKNFEFTPVTTKPLAQNEKTMEQNKEFKFSAPLVLAEYLKPLKALNNFKFSEPLVKKRKSIHADSDDQENKIVETNKTKKINGDINNESLIEKFKPKEGTWECSMCLIRNQPEKLKCAACQNPKLKPKADNPIAAPLTIKPAGSTWECPTCMIRNKDELQKCAACQENKPSDGIKSSTKKNIFSKPTDPLSKPPMENSLGNKFAKPTDSWECPSCMIVNKNELANCLACTAPKPGSTIPVAKSASFGSDFKKKSNEWECPSCMVRNKADADKCQCCETANPDKSTIPSVSKAPVFNFGINQSSSTSFNFGIPPASQSVSTKTNASLVFGEKREVSADKTSESFSFGIPAKETESIKESSDKVEAPKNVSFGLESKTNEVTPSKPTFTFGVTSKSTSEASEATPCKSTPTFSFGSASKSDTTTTTPSFSFGSAKKSEEEPKTNPPTFSFGTSAKEPAAKFSFGSTNKTENTTNEATKINPLLKPGEKLPEKASIAPVGFSFGLPKSPLDTAAKSVKPTKRTRPADDSVPPPAKINSFVLPSNDDMSKKNSPFAQPKADAPGGGFNYVFGAASPSAPTFGSTVSQADSSKPEISTFKFGSSSETPKPSNGFSFGSTPAPAFGAKPSTAETNKPFSFTTPTQPSQVPDTFSFGKTNEAKPATFSFTPAAPENKLANQFSFAPAKTQQPTFGTAPSFNFSANQKPTDTSFGSNAPGNLFGGAPPNPSVNGNFSFGAAGATQQKTGFSFGAASQNVGFNFGSGGAPTAPGGFNFGAAAPTIDASPKPSFNFTGGAAIASFSAPPVQEATSAPQRKIKKAVRRVR